MWGVVEEPAVDCDFTDSTNRNCNPDHRKCLGSIYFDEAAGLPRTDIAVPNLALVIPPLTLAGTTISVAISGMRELCHNILRDGNYFKFHDPKPDSRGVYELLYRSLLADKCNLSELNSININTVSDVKLENHLTNHSRVVILYNLYIYGKYINSSISVL